MRIIYNAERQPNYEIMAHAQVQIQLQLRRNMRTALQYRKRYSHVPVEEVAVTSADVVLHIVSRR